ncbi:MAG: hypothetical protein NZ898_05205 [Myxococcota bacterium]|nr:hypothetical protein [Myxococcota bacterium]MDW8363474.1 hypothetical protein [Myxococcales bacterium]
MSEPNGQAGLPLGSASALDADEKELRRGRGRMLAVMIGAGVLAVGGLLFLLVGSGGDAEVYGTFGRHLQGIRRDHFDAFWSCVLQGGDPGEIRNNEQLRELIVRRAENGRARFGLYVRERCMPKLSEIEPKLAALIPPQDLEGQVRELSDASSRLRAGWTAFIAHLDGLAQDAPFDAEAARSPLGEIERAWFDYRRVHKSLNDTVRERLGR